MKLFQNAITGRQNYAYFYNSKYIHLHWIYNLLGGNERVVSMEFRVNVRW